MSRAKRAIPRRKGPLLLTVGITSVVVVAGVALAGQFRADDGPGANPAPTTVATGATGNAGPESSQSPTAAPSAQGADTPLAATDAARACAGEITTTEAVLDAARIAATHWREHVRARTDLLSGKNTEATTRAIWKRTRLAGPADEARLRAATTAQLKARGGCKGFTGPAATDCRQRLAALNAAASAGRAAAGDWAAHLAMMAAHAAGDFGAEHAQTLWVEAWQSAPKNLDAFARASAALAEAPDCTPS
jgi:hypothetical protein